MVRTLRQFFSAVSTTEQSTEEEWMLYRNSFSAPVFGLRREIDRLFEDTFGRGEGMNSWSPAVDVRESDNEMRLEVELPGINPEEVEVTADNGILTVRGEKKTERKEGDEESRYHVVERSYGTFMRSFQLPQGLDESKIEADFNNGILSIHIPKAALPQPHKIQIGSRAANEVSSGSKQAQVSSGSTRTQTTDKGRSTKGEQRQPEIADR
jgi:HSP20 family protein